MPSTTLTPLPRYPDLKLDLSFHPIANDDPKRLARTQIEAFNKDGYLLGVKIFERELAAQLLRFCEGPLTARIKSDAKAGIAFDSYHHQFPELFAVATNPLLLEYLRDLIGPDIICQVSQYICKRPGDQWPSIYHQDASFNPLSRAGSVVVWIACDDADEGNGCMRFHRGSHCNGHLPCTGSNDKQPFAVIEPEKHGPLISAEVKAGEAILFSDLLIHGAPANPSPTRLRPGLTLTFCSADVIPYKDWDKSSILCCGCDRYHHWRVNPRPWCPAHAIRKRPHNTSL